FDAEQEVGARRHVVEIEEQRGRSPTHPGERHRSGERRRPGTAVSADHGENARRVASRNAGLGQRTDQPALVDGQCGRVGGAEVDRQSPGVTARLTGADQDEPVTTWGPYSGEDRDRGRIGDDRGGGEPLPAAVIGTAEQYPVAG